MREGIYYFGGKVGSKELNDNTLRYARVTTDAGCVYMFEFLPIKTSGVGPCARFGHSMVLLPQNHAICIVGGRNDENAQPVLNDLHIFLLDQKVWLKVKFSVHSERLD